MNEKYQKYKETFSEDFSVKHKITTFTEKSFFHIHDDFELFFLCSDNVVTMIDDQTQSLRKNTLLLFNHMNVHYNYLSKPNTLYERYVVCFKPEIIESFSTSQTNLLECFYYRPFDQPCILPLTDEEMDSLIQMLERMIDLSADTTNQFGVDLYPRLLLCELLVTVNRIYRNYHHISLSEDTNQFQQIYPVMNYIHDHLQEELSLDSLSKMFYFNKYNLCTLFKNVTGMSPKQYLIHCRLVKAKRLLANGTSVDEVCSLVGYNNLAHFSRSFKQYTGISPKKYQLSILQ